MKEEKQSRNHLSKSFTLGRQNFAKISEVEGSKMSQAMEAEFQEFDRRGLTPEERRAIIASRYGTARPGRRPSW